MSSKALNHDYTTQEFTSDQNLGDCDTPIIIMSTNSDSFCHIINLNASAAAIFGYTKNELLSKKIFF